MQQPPKAALSHLRKQISPFEKPQLNTSIRQLVNTIVPFLVLWYLAYESLAISYWLTLPLTILASGFVIRTFIIFHDCCHHSFFSSKLANEIVGNITGILTLTPYQQWRHSHSLHHATSGNLDKRGDGDIWVLTVDEYLASSAWQRFFYRVYRNPIILFGFGPIYQFLISYRFNKRGAKRKERMNTYLINVGIAAIVALMCLLVGWKAFLLVQVPIFYLSAMGGIWLFYVQHQFENSYYEQDEEWEYIRAAIDGSSYYKLPRILQWLSGNIGFHHVHHLSPRVPNYHLEDVHEATPALTKVNTITLKSSLQSVRIHLWSEEHKQLVTFRSIKPLLKQAKLAAAKHDKDDILSSDSAFSPLTRPIDEPVRQNIG